MKLMGQYLIYTFSKYNTKNFYVSKLIIHFYLILWQLKAENSNRICEAYAERIYSPIDFRFLKTCMTIPSIVLSLVFFSSVNVCERHFLCWWLLT